MFIVPTGRAQVLWKKAGCEETIASKGVEVSTTSHSGASLRQTSHRYPATVISLMGLLTLLTIGAVQGGLAMVTDPKQPLGMSTDYLEGTPIDDYLLPGLFLLGIAVASVLTTVGLLFDWRWRWAATIERSVGFRWPWIGAVAIGAVLLAFEILELFLVPFHPVMHPLLIAGSLAIIGLVFTPSARNHLAADG